MVEVRVRGRGFSNQNGLWSNIRTVTLSDDDDDRPALTITGSPVTVAPGSTATYTVALTKAYAGTLRIMSDDTSAARVSPASLTFTAANHNTARTVTVTGVGNGTAVINHAFRLTGASADAIPDAGTVGGDGGRCAGGDGLDGGAEGGRGRQRHLHDAAERGCRHRM